ncbi:MAG: hypothetical protein HKN88_10020 [Gammaproteobacteria bacterium]|nr:hypothetical protein [Gammaproteobacteria bacterium]NNC98392.1 hypothetical protein [Gammaproteobacteria bacterium]NNM13060.1 hypothetical protein [Gammaproteobacteria bacterium]
MRPITVLTLIILGSCLAISICLIAVWGLLFLSAQDPEISARVSSELKLIPRHIAIFIPLTVVAWMGFITSQKQKSSRFIWQFVMWGSLGLVGLYYIKVI